MRNIICSIFILFVVPFTAAADQYLFNPHGSEFAILFPAMPILSEYYTYEGNECKTYDAQLLFWNQTGGLRAEAITCKTHKYQSANRENLLSMMREHAIKSGVTEAAFQYRETENLKIGSYRGIISAVSNTFVYTAIIGENSSIILVGSAPYSLYPKLGYEKFINSVRYTPLR